MKKGQVIFRKYIDEINVVFKINAVVLMLHLHITSLIL